MNSTIQYMPDSSTSSNATDILTDEELLLGYRDQGDRGAFDELVQRYERELFGYLRHYLGDADLAEDVFQQTFLQVHLKCSQFDSDRKVRPWLYTVATHQAIDMQRRNRRHRMISLDRSLGAKSGGDENGLVDLLGNGEPEPGGEAEAAETRDQVRAAVDSLPDQTKQVVVLVYFQGLKYREAAEVLSIPVGTVKSRLNAAVRKLSETLSHCDLPK